MPAPAGMWQVWSTFPGIDRLVADPDATEERAAWRSLAQVLDRWAERNPNGTLLDYRTLVKDDDFEAQPLLSFRKVEGDRLTLTTLHQAKGLELDVVFIADAVDGVFPDLRARDSLLGVRHLLPNVPTDPADYRAFRLREESRLAYTAMTRARRRVVWTATERGLDEGPGRPSRFFTKVALSAGGQPHRPATNIVLSANPTGGERTPVTAAEAESALRRRVGDIAVPKPMRLAALRALALGPRWGLRSPDQFHGVLARGDNDGLVGPDPVLSPSQAQSYEHCPRRYVLERRLRVGADTSLHAAFGTLIHDVLEAVESAAAADRPHGDLEAALRELEERFDPTDFGGMPFAESWFRRAVAGLTKLYSAWPAANRRSLFVERSITAEIGEARWTGRADRIDVGGSGLTIVDYKTSKQPATVAESEESLQLGFYAIAAGQDPEIAQHGPIAGAELWYPMAKAKGVTTRRFDMSRLEDVAERLADIASGIRSEEWPPNSGSHCERCALQTMCPAWATGGPEFS